jgi:outer membrane receptor protein involved in Fe transport
VYQTNLKQRSLRSALLLGAASVATISLSVPVMAQEGAVETVVVTGSRIPQQGLYSTSPVTAVGQQEMKFEGTTNVENLINNLPSAFADFGSNESNGSVGTATVNLRDLGCNRTLVLIDSKRLMPGDNELPCADLNQIPAALVDHIEVLTGGASATYGSDAVAGVVNFIMRKDFEGIEVDGQYSVFQHDNNNSRDRAIVAAGLGGITPGTIPLPPRHVLDGADVDGTVVMGVNSDNGKANLTLYAGYRNIQAVLESQRDVSACGTATTYSGSFICAGSSTAARIEGGNIGGGRFISLDGGACGNCTIDPITGDVRGFTQADRFNFAPFNYFQRPDTRYTFGASGHYEVNKMLDVYTSLMFMDDHTVAQIAPSGLFFGTLAQVNCDNPFLGSAANTSSPEYNFCTSAGLGPTDNATMFIGRRNVEGGNRQDNLRHTSYRMVVGAKGDLGGGWAYDVSGQYGDTILAEEYLNDMSIQRIQRSLLVKDVGGVPMCESAIDGTDPNCVPWDIFQPNGVTPAAIKYLDVPGFREGSTEEWVLTGSVTGDLGEWGIQSPWAKSPVAVALGGEYRQEKLDNRVDLEFSSGDLAGQGGPTLPTHGGFNVTEFFGEARVPIVQNVPFFQDFTLNGGYRYSSYNTAGHVVAYKYGAEWQVVDDIKLRASFDRAVRAPNVIELFTGQGISLWGGQDPCSGTTPTQSLAYCENTGVTAGQYGHVIECPAAQCSAFTGGNPNLRPETSDTRSVGFVFTPTFFDGFTATVDYFHIKVDGLIGVVPEANILDACGFTGDPGFCGAIHRGIGGVLFGLPPGGGFITDLNTNTGSLKTSGIDVEANYNTSLGDWGMGDNGGLSFNFLGTWTKEFVLEPIPTGFAIKAGLPPPYTGDCAGHFGIVCGTPIPKWRHKLRVTWSSPWDFDLSVAWRYMSSVTLDANQTNAVIGGSTFDCSVFGGGFKGLHGACDISDNRISSFNYFDVAGNWTVRQGVELHMGVNNIFDKDPPLLDSNTIGVASPPFGNGNTFPQVYDSLGRLLFIGATIKY